MNSGLNAKPTPSNSHNPDNFTIIPPESVPHDQPPASSRRGGIPNSIESYFDHDMGFWAGGVAVAVVTGLCLAC